jgi:hypothetical protein
MTDADLARWEAEWTPAIGGPREHILALIAEVRRLRAKLATTITVGFTEDECVGRYVWPPDALERDDDEPLTPAHRRP